MKEKAGTMLIAMGIAFEMILTICIRHVFNLKSGSFGG